MTPTPEHTLFRDTVRAFVVAEIAPHISAWDEAESFPREFVHPSCQTLGRTFSKLCTATGRENKTTEARSSCNNREPRHKGRGSQSFMSWEHVMNQGFGREVPAHHIQPTHREVTKYLVIIPTPEGTVAKLFLGNREQVAELDANTEEVATMIKGLAPSFDATSKEWDRPFSGHSDRERAAASVYVLKI